MKLISLRKAKLDDLSIYTKFYNDDDAQFLYSNHDDNDENNLKEKLYNIGIEEKILNEINVEDDYKENLKNIYLIMVDQVICGYIKIEKKAKDIVIRDMALSDYGIMNELYLSKLFYCLTQKTKTEKIIIYFCNNTNAKTLQRIGFEKLLGRLEKTVGI